MSENDTELDEDTLDKIRELGNSVIGGWGSDMFSNLEKSANAAGVFLASIHSAMLYATPDPDNKRVQQIVRATYFQIISAHLDDIESYIAAEAR